MTNVHIIMEIMNDAIQAIALDTTKAGIGKAICYVKYLCEGIQRGVIIDLDEAAACLRQVKRDIESSTGTQIRSASVGISGPDLASLSSHGVAYVSSGRVQRDDIKRAGECAMALAILSERQAIYAEYQDFSVNAEGHIKDPTGMPGNRLDTDVFIIHASKESIGNIEKVFERTHVGLDRIVPVQHVVSRYTVTGEEGRRDVLENSGIHGHERSSIAAIALFLLDELLQSKRRDAEQGLLSRLRNVWDAMVLSRKRYNDRPVRIMMPITSELKGQ